MSDTVEQPLPAVAITEIPKEGKRKSGYARMKTRAKLAEADVAALERLVAKLLDHLYHATDPLITNQQRERLRTIEVATRAALEE